MTRCTPAFTVALLLLLASNAPVVAAFVRPPLYPFLPPSLVLLHATEPTRDVFTASLFEDTAADPLRQDGYWEQLFTKGSSVPASPVSLFKESTMPALEGEGVEVVSFDLDDTLWCGKTVISNANKYVWVRVWVGVDGGVREGWKTSTSPLHLSQDANLFFRHTRILLLPHPSSALSRSVPPLPLTLQTVPCKPSSKPTTPPWSPRANPPFPPSCGS